MESFERPKVLPCQHTFCEDCLKRCQDSSGGLLCPTCRREYSAIDVSKLPNDYTRLALLEAVDSSVDSMDSPADAAQSKIKDVRYEKQEPRATVVLKLRDSDGKEVLDRRGVNVKVINPSGDLVQCQVTNASHEYKFLPSMSGTYKIYASVNGMYLSNSPKELTIFPPLRQSSSVFGEAKYKGAHDIAAFNGEIFVTDRYNRCIVVMNRSGEQIRSFEIKESNMGHFDPFGITISITGLLYITDMYNHEVFVCDTRGRVRQRFGKDILKKPNGVSLTKNNEILVVDYDDYCLYMFENDGRFKRKFGSRGKDYGQFNHPWFVAITGNGDWIVSDCNNRRLQVFDGSGTFRFLRSIPVGYLVRGVVVDHEDKIYISSVIDSGWTKMNYKHVVMVYHANGKFYGEISLRDELLRPRGMCITEDDSGEHILIVTDDSNALHKYKMI
ncbi:uncharacterized protein [Antedon mediterranea]